MPATVRKKQTAERCEFSDRPLVLYAFVPLPRDHDVPDQSAIRSNWQVCGGGGAEPNNTKSSSHHAFSAQNRAKRSRAADEAEARKPRPASKSSGIFVANTRS